MENVSFKNKPNPKTHRQRTVSEEIKQFVAENGGNEHDALNIALAKIKALETEGNGPICFSCGKRMKLAPSECVYECECGYWCYSSS